MKKAAVPSILVVVVLLAVGVTAEAQQSKKYPRSVFWLFTTSRLTHFRRQREFELSGNLRALGYVEGKNIGIESRYAIKARPAPGAG